MEERTDEPDVFPRPETAGRGLSSSRRQMPLAGIRRKAGQGAVSVRHPGMRCLGDARGSFCRNACNREKGVAGLPFPGFPSRRGAGFRC